MEDILDLTGNKSVEAYALFIQKRERFELFVSDTCITYNASTPPIQITQLRLRFFGPTGWTRVP
jgi:hypothetical protein